MEAREPNIPDLTNPNPPIMLIEMTATDPVAVQVLLRSNMAVWYGNRHGFNLGKDGFIRSSQHNTSCKLWIDFYNHFRNRIWEDYWDESTQLSGR
jgi:hypothetical protein